MPIKPLIIALGRRGGDCASRLDLQQLGDASLLFADTDIDDLATRPPAQQLRLGSHIADEDFVRNDPDFSYKAAMAERSKIEAQFANADIVFIVAGLGGGTGAGGSKALSRIAKEAGLPVVAFVTRPFGVEGADRVYRGRRGVSDLRKSADVVVSFSQDQLLAFAERGVKMGSIIAVADDFVRNSITAFLDYVGRAGSPADVEALLDESDESIFSYGVSDTVGGVVEAAKFAVHGPFFEGAALSKTRGMLLSVRSRSSLSEAEVQRATGALLGGTVADASVFLSQVVVPALDNEVQVMAHLFGTFGVPLARVDNVFIPGPTG